MTREEKIKEEVEKTLNSFDKTDSIEVNPFLYTRIAAQINTLSNKKSLRESWLLKFGIIIFILVLNAAALINYFNGNSLSKYRNDYLLSLNEEYSLSTNKDYKTILLKGN
jgi:hypothetical protein